VGIWIRSQNGIALCKASEIWCEGEEVYVNGPKIYIGKYETEAEAIQVLDMIQEHAEGPNTTEKQMAVFTGTYKRVFQMPPAGFSKEG
jgi:hypothetical protein